MTPEAASVRTVGRYAIHGEIASGGMATVHLGRLLGAAGFARTVAVKRMHAELAKDPEFVSMFVDEARLAARIHHPNVVSTLDVVALSGELFVVMEYIHGEALASLLRAARARGERMPVRVAVRVATDLLNGLHAAHEAEDETGQPLGIVHRDVSPQNALVGADGVTRVIDFGVAKAAGRLQTTREGQIKGKIAYMSPEQLLGKPVDRRSDVYSASVVLWEMLTGSRLFQGDNQGHVLQRVLAADVQRPSQKVAEVPLVLDEVVMRGLARGAAERFATARDMAVTLEAVAPQGSAREVGDWVKALAAGGLESRAQQVSGVEGGTSQASAIIGGDPNTATQSNPLPAQARLVVRPTDLPTSTTVSSSMSAAADPGRRPRRSFVLGLAVGSVLALAAAAASVRALRVGQPTPTAAPGPPATALTAQPSDVASAAPVTAPLESSENAATTSDKPSPPPVRAGTGKPKAAPAVHVSTQCNPPYVVDDRGVRTYKRECVTPR